MESKQESAAISDFCKSSFCAIEGYKQTEIVHKYCNLLNENKVVQELLFQVFWKENVKLKFGKDLLKLVGSELDFFFRYWSNGSCLKTVG